MPTSKPNLQYLSDFFVTGVPCPMVLVESGIFQMGSTEFSFEEPIHPVHIPYDYHIGQYQVTQQLYHAIMGKNPSHFKGKKRPVEKISWNNAKQFIEKFNQHPDLQKYLKINSVKGKFRLPTEAEWEYAARGGKYSQGYEYCGSDDLKQVGWFNENSGNETKPVGLLHPNELGLYDLSGNVFEWCEDNWHGSYKNARDNGNAWIVEPNRGAYRVVRGGSSFNSPVLCRPAYRYYRSPVNRFDYIGFRLVFSPSQESPSDHP